MIKAITIHNNLLNNKHKKAIFLDHLKSLLCRIKSLITKIKVIKDISKGIIILLRILLLNLQMKSLLNLNNNISNINLKNMRKIIKNPILTNNLTLNLSLTSKKVLNNKRILELKLHNKLRIIISLSCLRNKMLFSNLMIKYWVRFSR